MNHRVVITARQKDVLRVLAQGARCEWFSAKDVAEALGIIESNAATHLRNLAHDGFLDREQAPEDDTKRGPAPHWYRMRAELRGLKFIEIILASEESKSSLCGHGTTYRKEQEEKAA